MNILFTKLKHAFSHINSLEERLSKKVDASDLVQAFKEKFDELEENYSLKFSQYDDHMKNSDQRIEAF
jgi:hypothetical protein